MRLTVAEKARVAIDALNEAVLAMREQIGSDNPDSQSAKKKIMAAWRNGDIFYRAYSVQKPDFILPQIQEFDCSELPRQLEIASIRFSEILEIYLAKVGR